MNYRIVIPSYKRADTIVKKTLPFLVGNYGFDRQAITIFVADQNELAIYKTACAKYNVEIIVGVPTLCGQRNFINNFYKEGDRIVQIDDDIEAICAKVDDKNYEKVTDLDGLIHQGFNECEKHKTKLWGIAAVLNPYFMKHTISTDLKYVGGGFWGEIIDHSPELDLVLEDKEDFERSIRYFKKFGSIIRFNGYSFKTNAYKGNGGMQETRTEQRITESVEWLLKNFPEYCVLNENRKNHAEVRLLANPKVFKQPDLYDGLF